MTCYSAEAIVDHLGLVGAKHITFGLCAISKMRDDTTGRQLLVRHEGLAEMYDVLEAGQQYQPQRDAADRTMPREGIAADRWIESVKRLRLIHPLGDETNALRGFAAGACESDEQSRRLIMQRPAADRIDVNLIALHAVRSRS